MARARLRRTAVVSLIVLVAGLLSAGVAAAVSGGGYQPSEQDCSPMADNHDVVAAQPGCHNFKVNVADSQGTKKHPHRYGEVWIDQQAQNDNPHSGGFRFNTNSDGKGLGVSGTFDTHWQPFPPGSCGLFDLAIFPLELIVNTLNGNPQGPCTLPPPTPPSGAPTVTPSVQTGTPDGSIAQLAQGGKVYIGADDNLNTGEHDGVDGKFGTKHSANGPSDGGAIVVDWHPTQVAAWVATLAAAPGAPGPFLSNPVPLVSAGFGSCADGICLGLYSAKTTVYQGGTKGERDVYNYAGKKWDPAACSSGSAKDEQQCAGPNKGDPKTMDGWRKAEKQNVVAQPGVQIYEDPDPEGSPIGPYPLPALYAGSCGVAAGGGAAPAAPASPVTNSAGQVVVSTGC